MNNNRQPFDVTHVNDLSTFIPPVNFLLHPKTLLQCHHGLLTKKNEGLLTLNQQFYKARVGSTVPTIGDTVPKIGDTVPI